MPLTASIRDNAAASPCKEIKTPAGIQPLHGLEELQDADKSWADRPDGSMLRLRCLSLEMFSVTLKSHKP